MAYPATTFSMTPTAGTQTLGTVDHNNIHNVAGSAIASIANTVLGTTAGTNVLKNFVSGNLAARTNGETFGTPILTNPTINLSSDATGDTFYRNSGGSVSRLGIGTVSQHLVVSAGTLPSWSDQQVTGTISSIGQQGTTTTGSTSYVDIPNAAATISPVTAKNILVIATGSFSNNAVQSCFVQLLIGGTVVQGYNEAAGLRKATATHEGAFALSAGTVVGSGSTIVKLQYKVGAGTMTVYKPNITVLQI